MSTSIDPGAPSRAANRRQTHFAILGAGPTGLEAALAVAERGYSFTLFEAAPRVAGHIHKWRHVKLFTPWALNASPRMRQALANAGKVLPPDTTCPSGGDLIEHLFEPLVALPALRDNLRLGTRVRSIGRQGLLKHEEIGSSNRAQRPFRLLLEGPDGRESIESADLVLDCTGNTLPNSLGDGGIPAPGERALARLIHRDVPNFEEDTATYAGKTTLLIGLGHSAQTALEGLDAVARQHAGSRIIWALRRSEAPSALEEDSLPERSRLTRMAEELAHDPPQHLQVHYGCVVDSLSESGDGIDVELRFTDGHTHRVHVHQVLSLTGRVGDHLLYRQLQVHECYATNGPMKLAAALLSSSGAGGDCLTQTSLGPETLRSPEPGFFILGSKSYGRRNDYLMQVGWQQVEEIFQLLD